MQGDRLDEGINVAMYNFDYYLAKNIADAVAALQDRPDSKILAGGQSLLASMRLRLASPEQLIDIGRIPELTTISATGNNVTLGAMVRHADVTYSSEIGRSIPALSALAGQIGDRMIRRLGSIGGSIANNDPAADYPAALVALNAKIKTSKRSIAADDFFRGLFETALDPDEIITAIEFPVPRRAAYVKFKHPASRFAIAGVFVAESTVGVRVAVTGAGPCVFRLPEIESALSNQFSTLSIVGSAVSSNGLNSDLHASAEYRAHLIPVIVRRAVELAVQAVN